LLAVVVKVVIEIMSTPSGARITISGGLGDDAKPYQEKLVKQKLGEV
jgi:hypothetical protein